MKIGYHFNCIEMIIFRDKKSWNLQIVQVFFYSFGKYASHLDHQHRHQQLHHHQHHDHDCAHIERKGKISIETSEKHEKGSDEVVDSRLQIVMMLMVVMMKMVRMMVMMMTTTVRGFGEREMQSKLISATIVPLKFWNIDKLSYFVCSVFILYKVKFKLWTQQ